jgi:D-xylonolactonase
VSVIYDDLTLGNGMGFSPDLATLYLTDSNTRRIYAADYDRETGDLANRRVLVQVEDEGSVPDGMTVDTAGTIWSARWDGRAIFAYGPDGTMRGKVPFPVRKVSSVTFAGPGYDIAYATTAGGGQRGEKEGLLAGSLFRVDLGVSGRPPFHSRIGD